MGRCQIASEGCEPPQPEKHACRLELVPEEEATLVIGDADAGGLGITIRRILVTGNWLSKIGIVGIHSVGVLASGPPNRSDILVHRGVGDGVGIDGI